MCCVQNYKKTIFVSLLFCCCITLSFFFIGCSKTKKAYNAVKPATAVTVVRNAKKGAELMKASQRAKYLKTGIKELKYVGTNSKTGVKMYEAIHTINGVKKIVKIADFPSKYVIKMPEALYKASRVDHFKYCTNLLREQIIRNPELKNIFSKRQLEDIMNGLPKIHGLTWHHSEIPGQMELVSEALHQHTNHSGGYSIWGAGAGK